MAGIRSGRAPACVAAAFLILAQTNAWAGGGPRIHILSTRPDAVTGNDALAQVTVPEDMEVDQVAIRLNGKDITAAFRANPAAHTSTGLVSGLRPGSNSLELWPKGQETASVQLAVLNHPITGPVFSGTQEQPFVCETAAFILPDGTSLGQTLDENCSAPTVVQYLYRPAAPNPAATTLIPLTDLSRLPPDVSYTTTSTGQKAPYIVRVETGTINRAIYQIAVLHDPFRDPAPGPFTPPTGWNGRLLYSFGGGCTGGWYRQGAATGLSLRAVGPGSLADFILSQGYASASATLNVFGNNCQDVTAAETMMMVREHFIETYGPPLFTFGRGGSGGAYQQIQIADNYPGLLDGIIPSATFPDVLATIQYLTDAQLLDHYFRGAGHNLTAEQKRAIAGVGVLENVTRIAAGAGRINPTVFCPPELPVSVRYDPLSNRTGARCDVFDHTVNVYGRDPVTGFARRPVDNTGVQYGLAALQAGAITPAQFLDLNERIGGYDQDGVIVRARSVADPVALRTAYSTGRVTHGGGGLATVPIIDLRRYSDRSPSGDLHLKYHSFGFRERLRRANGTAANEVMLVYDTAPGRMEEYTITKMDEWLTNLHKAASEGTVMDRIIRTRPADLTDRCYAPSGTPITEMQTWGAGECNRLFPDFPSPRMVAGGPVTNDVLKCRLKPIDFNDYGVAFTEEQKARARAIFADGVCDWTKPGVEQQKLSGTWKAY